MDFIAVEGADTAGGAVQCGGTQAVFTEAGNTEARPRLPADCSARYPCRRGPRMAVQISLHRRASLTPSRRERRSKFLDDIAVQFAGFAHAVKLIRALDRAQRAEHAVHRLGANGRCFVQHGELLQRHGLCGNVDGLPGISDRPP